MRGKHLIRVTLYNKKHIYLCMYEYYIKKLLHKKTVTCSILYSYAMFPVDHNLWSTPHYSMPPSPPPPPLSLSLSHTSLVAREMRWPSFFAEKSHLSSLSRSSSHLSLVLYVMTTTTRPQDNTTTTPEQDRNKNNNPTTNQQQHDTTINNETT